MFVFGANFPKSLFCQFFFPSSRFFFLHLRLLLQTISSVALFPFPSICRNTIVHSFSLIKLTWLTLWKKKIFFPFRTSSHWVCLVLKGWYSRARFAFFFFCNICFFSASVFVSYSLCLFASDFMFSIQITFYLFNQTCWIIIYSPPSSSSKIKINFGIPSDRSHLVSFIFFPLNLKKNTFNQIF